MKCFVPVCENSSTISQGITFHRFPTDDRTRATWLQALGKQGSCLASGEVVCSQHFLTEDFIETRSGLKKLRRGASPFVINKLGLLNVNQKSKEVNQQAEMDGVYKVTTNVEMKNEKPDDSLLSVDIGVLVKQEPLDQALMDTYDNIYDSQFDVVKEEVTSNSSGMEIIYNSEYDVNSDVPYNLSFKEEITELVEESESPEHSSFSDLSARHSYMMTYVKVEHLDSFTSLPADCALAHDTPSRSTEDTSLNEASALKENILNGQKKRKLKKVKNGVQSENGFLVTPNKNIELSYCKLCSYKSISKANLERHMNKHSSKTMSLTCEICEYKFTTRGNLHRHMRNHSGEKPFSCNICGYKFFWKFRLDFHMKSHTGGPEYLIELDVEGLSLVKHSINTKKEMRRVFKAKNNQRTMAKLELPKPTKSQPLLRSYAQTPARLRIIG
ncbi:jg8843 [Pararge aegeria aegeria]|uniref:Jg8843 protein n=1 Tax=Pararge aegeria aegeria TaxID=348720 RepID=A0A8S4SE50_9NEOP|nr:jg8843 [Pararge aegeria aegeria]